MCGIAGGTGPDSPGRRAVVDAQLARLMHRGPDSAGYLAGARGTVGQSRLAIIDVAHGDPPLTDESGDIRVALNGEIYNYRALRDELLAAGHRFVSACDTEVLAHLAESLDAVQLCRRLDGMFALAVWDERRGRLVLGRDRLGKKPLYYWHGGGELVFGSEIKAVLADPRVPREPDLSVLPAYLAYGYAPTPGTFFAGVRSLPPGCVLVFEPGGTPVVERYWDVPTPRGRDELLRGSTASLAGELRRLLTGAVRKRLMADVPLGAFLSGGVDSSAIVAIMSQLSSTPVRTFSIGFREERFDETSWARAVSQRFGTVHEELVVEPDATRLLDEVLDGCDQPFGDSSALPTYLLSRMTAQHVTVALSGDGGDELFAGYDRFAAALALSRIGRVPQPARAAAGRLVARAARGDRGARLATALTSPMPDAYLRLNMVFSPEVVEALAPGTSAGVLRRYDEIWAGSTGAPALHRILDLNLRTYLLDDLLVKVDRMSMQHGLEVRSPLLDADLLAFALRVPPGEHLRGTSLKRLLKASVRDLLPAEVLDRRKQGFGVPVDAWFRGELRQELRGRLLDDTPRLARYLQHDVVRRLVEEHDRGVPHGQRLWMLLVLERFLEREGW